jgi:uracil phosphoribosyltransferase
MITQSDFRNLNIIDHPLIRRDLTIIRNLKTSNVVFRTILHRITKMIAYETASDLALKRIDIHTPLEPASGYLVADDVILVPILRAGLGMVDGFLDLLPDAKVGHIGLYRNEETLKPVDYYSKFPNTLDKSIVFLLDPMLATGGSASAAVGFIKGKGGKNIRLITLVAAPEGVEKITRDHPDVKIFTTALDRQLNQNGYILPGLGDAGDRVFGTD